MPRTGPGVCERAIGEVSHHMLLPRRWTALSRRPTRAARISPGRWGRQTYVSVSSTSVIRRPSAHRAMTARADSTSGSSGMVSNFSIDRGVAALLTGQHGLLCVYRLASSSEPDHASRVLLREATLSDLPPLIDVQQSGAVRGLSHIFPQSDYPFPRDEIYSRWAQEVADPSVNVYVVENSE